MNERYMEIALKEANKAFRKGEVPIGAVIVYKNKVIAKAHNQKEQKNNPLKHAEIIAIEKASKKLKTWRLLDCELYVTIEPCLMCSGALIQSRIKKLVYGSKNEKFGYVESIKTILNDQKNNHKIEVISGIKEKETANIMKLFFKKQRENSFK